MVEIKGQIIDSVGIMSATWLTLLFTAWLLGECQSSLPDEFAPPATSHEAGKVNNVTLTPPGHSVVAQGNAQDFDRDLDQDPLTPHAAPSSQRKLSRGKRFVAFPQGSSASVSQRTLEQWDNMPSLCTGKKIIGIKKNQSKWMLMQTRLCPVGINNT